ncbi:MULTISPECIES: amidase domain-containing protein [Bacillus cereus group]|uniref:amidase domain-containing protein n=1 Tax=Bacillus cereus group TaxID=86661 RepID=UPI00101E9E48|nr:MULTISPECIES: amidase domain-containing protein [Bacillus cereus group]MDO6632772.1 amidase domain-containing protein [Bacillus thuringiensis]MDO6662127.1 amidase domain-containing protein [Bacillus thuringiensis]MDO6702967.1 amidase domain-containing protein [Bacillus thuringiensis]
MTIKKKIMCTILSLGILVTGGMLGDTIASAASTDNFQEIKKQQSELNVSSKKLNLEAALVYVNNWWDKRNPDYEKWDPNDCMNYVSQILKAGGIEEKVPSYIKPSGIDTNKDYWYSKKQGDNTFTESSTWINVEDFYNFWSKTQRVIMPNELDIMRDVEIGDVIQLQKKAGGRYYHAMFVVNKDSETVYLTGHTNDRQALDIRKIQGDNFRVIKFSN